jgi:protein-ribulosamine 3-kinase
MLFNPRDGKSEREHGRDNREIHEINSFGLFFERRKMMTSLYEPAHTATMGRSDIPQILLTHIEKLEPNATFTGSLPIIQSSAGVRYFAKIGSSSEKDQYIGEVESLRAMNEAAPGLSPRVLASGFVGNSGNELHPGQPYFLSEYKDLRSLTSRAADVLAKRLATELHRYKSDKGFGFDVPTYCGATRQENGWYESWDECYSEMIGSLLRKLKQKGRFGDLCSKGEEVRKK